MRPADQLSLRAVNRALLSRQLLLDRPSLAAAGAGRPAQVVQTVEHLIGMQAQTPFPPYYGLHSRLGGFVPDDLAGVDMAALAAAGRALVEAGHTSAEQWLGQPVQPPLGAPELAAGAALTGFVTRRTWPRSARRSYAMCRPGPG
jgi:hypothetical protein